MEIVSRYGDLDDLSKKFSYQNVNALAKNPYEALASDTPTLVRVDLTYGSGSSSQWLYRVLQPMFMFLGVNSDKFPKEMVYDLASTIANNPIYNKLTLAEIMLFVSRFKSGMYGRFYGDTSYVLTITEGLKTFWSERETYYAQVEREKVEQKIAEEKKKPHISFEEWKREKEAKGEQVNFSMSVVQEEGRSIRIVNPIETLVEKAQNLVTNKYNLSMKSLLEMRKMFKDKNGMTPEEVIEKLNKNEL